MQAPFLDSPVIHQLLLPVSTLSGSATIVSHFCYHCRLCNVLISQYSLKDVLLISRAFKLITCSLLIRKSALCLISLINFAQNCLHSHTSFTWYISCFFGVN